MDIKSKSKGFIGEFKTFIMRGNVIDLAVGVIIGGAFQAIVNSLVNDLISPILSLFTKGINFSDKFVVLTFEDVNFKTAAQAADAGYATFNYGSLITAIINFLIMSFVIFLIVKGINKVAALGKKEEEPVAVTVKVCPFCKSEVSIDAVKCPHCTSDLPEEETEEVAVPVEE
ncbi:MAG: large conductance mechanosensitive channel protein MscL [Faecalibacterium sp.]|nr:large conductance mechanosensitive channel protein MscL [Ruminococcus sp.]MCM1392849.1 large conductance mechanosensitive channel protein MscL [Ruminococcus sp.]MCM1486412.1 large conductance mechanosensitive channel protein MscL [Faecalibacterium sp.]